MIDRVPTFVPPMTYSFPGYRDGKGFHEVNITVIYKLESTVGDILKEAGQKIVTVGNFISFQTATGETFNPEKLFTQAIKEAGFEGLSISISKKKFSK